MGSTAGRLLGVLVSLVAGCSPPPPGERTALPAPPPRSASPAPPTPVVAPDATAAASPSPPAPPSAASAAAPPGPCPADMALVDGDYCPELDQACLRRRKPWQCAEFARDSRCLRPLVHKRYCIDRYEWPNREGEVPTVMNSWLDGQASCRGVGKRLCTESEWTLACEGPERLAFPYGFVRDAQACPIDKPSPAVNEKRLYWPATQAAEVARLDQREPSGARARCVSGYGVHDLTGNVDEWVVSETGRPYRSALKGGNWGEYRNACRPVTRGHSEGFRYYQLGFRCCTDAP